jgi:hypothetical protein
MKKSTKTLLFTNVVCVFVLLATSVHAQFSGGIKGGINLATEVYPGFAMKSAVTGYGGAFARYQVNMLAFQLEGAYSVEGGNLQVGNTGMVNKYRVSYINVPLFIQGRFPEGVYMEFGAQYGFLSTSTYNFNNNGDVNIANSYEKNNFSIGGGLGYEFQGQGIKGLGINLRYMQGLTAISHSGSGDIKTRTFSIGLSQKF